MSRLPDMNRLTPGLCLASSIGVMLFVCSSAAALPPVPSMACPVIPTEQAPRIDGAIDEAAWKKADVQTTFYRNFGRKDGRLEMRLLSDGQWLYVSTVAYEPEILEKDQEIVSVFIAPFKTWDHFMNLSVGVTAAGIKERKARGFKGDDQDWRAAFAQHEDRWVVEIAVRIAPVFGKEISEGQAFDFNLSRTRAEVLGDDFDMYQQWSSTGASSGSRYRFGEVVFGSLSDRLREIATQLARALDQTRHPVTELSANAKQSFAAAEKQAEAALKKMRSETAPTGSAVRTYDRQATSLKRALRRPLLVDRGVIVWSCNPMATPLPNDLPPGDVKSVDQLDIRVLGDEWESAAIVVTNLTEQTMEGQVVLDDFVAADGKTKLAGWDVLQVRTAPLFPLPTGRSVRDPLPRLQEGGLFRVPADENELLWLTFKSRDVPPGRYTSTLTVRSLGDRHLHEVQLVLRVYPLALGAKGRPNVHTWNSMLRGKDWAERAAHCRDYYLTCSNVWNWDDTPSFVADADGNILDDTLDFSKYDRGLETYMQSGVHTYLAIYESRSTYTWPMRREDGSTEFNFKRWSPKYNEIFARWVRAFRDYMATKGLTTDRWAFYIMDEPFPGKDRREVISFARQIRKIDPKVRTYITFPIGRGKDAEILEVSKHVDIVQTIGDASPAVMEQVRSNVKEFWRYTILLRGTSPLLGYRSKACWEPMREGSVGTGFWVWDSSSQRDFLWRNRRREHGSIFPVIYPRTDGGYITSLRADAFREGIEDWKYLLMLDDALARAKQGSADPKIVAAAAAFRSTCLAELDDAESAYRYRDAARAHLLALHAALGDIDPAAVEAIEK